MQVSIVIPLLDEAESLPELHEWIVRVMHENNYSYEIIFIDDGSKDKSWDVITTLNRQDANVKAVKFRRNYGKSAALNIGFAMAQGDVVFTMDADLQDSPDELPALYKMIIEDKFDLVSGWKKKRFDNMVTKNLPSKLFNATTSVVSGIKLHDFNCGLKAYRNTVVKSVEVYGEMHRYIPILAKWAGFRKIGEKVVTHRERKYGESKFGFERFVNGFLDLISITFVTRFGKKPMHVFGLWGTLSFIAGFLIACYLGYAKIVWHEYKMTDRPLFYFALVSMIMGVQLFLAGFLGELISRNGHDRNSYLIEKEI